MNVSITDYMKSVVEEQVASGRYANASDYIRDLIRRDAAERTTYFGYTKAELDEETRIGLESGVSDQTPDEIYQRVKQRHGLGAAE